MSCRRPARSAPNGRSCRASRRTRPGSRPVAGSTRDARSWRQAVRKSSGSKTAAAARTCSSPRWASNISPPVTWSTSTSSRRRLIDRRGRRRVRRRGSLAFLVLVAAQHAQDRGHLGVPHRRVVWLRSGGASRTGGRKERAKVRFGHLGPVLELARPFCERSGALLGLVAGRACVARLLPERPDLGAKLGRLPPEVDELVGDRAAEVG